MSTPNGHKGKKPVITETHFRFDRLIKLVIAIAMNVGGVLLMAFTPLWLLWLVGAGLIAGSFVFLVKTWN